MSADSDIRRKLSCGPTGSYKLADQAATVRDITPKPKSIAIVAGTIMINDGSGWRTATEAEIEEMCG